MKFLPGLGDGERPTGNLVGMVVVNSLLSVVPAGVQLTVMNAPQAILENFTDASFEAHYGRLSPSGASFLWSFITASLALGALIGCFISVPLGEYFGLKKALMLGNNGILFAGSLCFAVAKPANSWELLALGKILMGVYSGVAMSLQTAFIQEASPPQFRGPLSCVVHIAMTIGSTLGAVLGTGALLGTEKLWPLLLVLPVLFGVPQLFLVSTFKDSPKYLHHKAPYSDHAIEAIFFYYGPEVDSRRVLAEFDREVAEAPASLSLWQCLLIPQYRSRLLLASLVNFVQIFTGLMAITNYSTSIIAGLGVSNSLAQYATAIGALFGFLSSFPVIFLIDKEGRRGMLLWSLLAITVDLFCFVLFGVLVEKGIGGKVPGALFVVSAFVFLVGYNFGPGPIAYFIAGELAPAPCRTSFLAVGVSVNWLSTMVSTFAFYPLDEAYGSLSFLLFAVPTAAATALLYAFLPETKPRIPTGNTEAKPLLQHGNSQTAHYG